MQSGISTACLYPMETSKSLELLLQEGYTHFEIFFNTVQEFQEPYLSILKEKLREHGATVRSVHPFTGGFEGILLFSDYETRFADSLEFYRQYCKAAQFLGAKHLILHGMQRQYYSEKNEERYFERYRALYRMAQEYGITVAQENVTRFFSEEPSFILRMKEALGEECAFCFDVKQAVRSQVEPMEMLRAMGEKLCHIHLSDNRPGETCLLPGQGTADLQSLFLEAQKFVFDGSVILEVYRTNFKEVEELRSATKKIEEWLLQEK